MKPVIAYLSKQDDRAIARAASQTNAAFVDLYELSETNARSARVYLSKDNLHPNDAGHALIAKAIITAINRDFAKDAKK